MTVWFWAGLIPFSVLATIALHVHFPREPWVPGLLVLSMAGLAALHLAGQRGLAMSGLVLAVAVGAVWYLSLKPRADRAWAPELAHIVTGDVAGDLVILHNIRDFRWRSRESGEARWISQSFDLNKLVGADMFTSVWSNPKIAHILLTFRFSDGQHVTFSVEIRREHDEKFSSVGGFFRQFELALIAATERDIVQLRTTFRREDVRIWPLRLSPEDLRPVFLAYVGLGNRISAQPEFYNTITANCTTSVWHLLRATGVRVPLNPALLLSGLLPAWLDDLDVLAGPGDFTELQARAAISEHARNIPPGAEFHDWIRARP